MYFLGFCMSKAIHFRISIECTEHPVCLRVQCIIIVFTLRWNIHCCYDNISNFMNLYYEISFLISVVDLERLAIHSHLITNYVHSVESFFIRRSRKEREGMRETERYCNIRFVSTSSHPPNISTTALNEKYTQDRIPIAPKTFH